MYISPSSFKAKPIIWVCLFTIGLLALLWHRNTFEDFSVPYSRPHSTPVPQFVAHGESQCLPEVTPELIEAATAKHAACRKYSPFVTGRARIATVTAHFGKPQEHYRKAFQTHLLHALVHGTEIKVLCDPIVGDLWNKPAFILNLLTREMMKPEKERLEWIQWADRDTLILDQCRPITSFLPPETSRTGSWWRREDVQQPHDNTTNLLVNKDHNGLNNGVFFLRVNNWAIDLFTAILAFTHYKPEVPLPFTEQSAMEQVLNTPQFKDQARYVPQHWFNGYPKGGPLVFKERENLDGLDDFQVRRGDYLVHFAGHGDRAKALPEWTDMLEQMEDVWKKGRVQRDIGEEVKAFWRGIEAAR